MKIIKLSLCHLSIILSLTACSSTITPMLTNTITPSDSSSPINKTAFSTQQITHGKYLATLLGCGGCHTNGALHGKFQSDDLFAGSDIGISYSNPSVVTNPAIIFPSNLTPDIDTGIGTWTVEQIIVMIKTGVDSHNRYSLPVMPWPFYANISDKDALDIAIYLKSLAPVSHQVPVNVQRGRSSTAPFVHFNILNSEEL